MNSMIEKIAMEKGMEINDVSDIFSGFSSLLVSKVPELKQVIDDIILNEHSATINEHLARMIILLQEKKSTVFASWLIPQQDYIIKINENAPLF